MTYELRGHVAKPTIRSTIRNLICYPDDRIFRRLVNPDSINKVLEIFFSNLKVTNGKSSTCMNVLSMGPETMGVKTPKT